MTYYLNTISPVSLVLEHRFHRSQRLPFISIGDMDVLSVPDVVKKIVKLENGGPDDISEKALQAENMTLLTKTEEPSKVRFPLQVSAVVPQDLNENHSAVSAGIR